MIALGTRVACYREAFVIRRRKNYGLGRDERLWGEWYIPKKGNFHVPVGCVEPSSAQRESGVLFRVPTSFKPITYAPATHLITPEETERRKHDRMNKGIAVIPQIASGIVVDRVKKMWGVSDSQHAWLYVVKPSYGSPCLYVPEDSVVPEVLM